MFCRKCGAELKPGARFCAKCGAEVPEKDRQKEADSPEKTEPVSASNEQEIESDSGSDEKKVDLEKKIESAVKEDVEQTVSPYQPQAIIQEDSENLSQKK